MKKFIFLYMVLFGMVYGCSFEKTDDAILCECVIFPTGTNSETYHVTLWDNGDIRTIYGIRSPKAEEMITQKKTISSQYIYSEIIKEKRGKLDEKEREEFDRLLTSCKGMKEDNPSEFFYIKDTWIVILSFNNRLYVDQITNCHDLKIEYICNKLKSLSPIPVKLRSWA